MPRLDKKDGNNRFDVLGKCAAIECDRFHSVSIRNPEMRCRTPKCDGRETCASVLFVYCYTREPILLRKIQCQKTNWKIYSCGRQCSLLEATRIQTQRRVLAWVL